MDMGYELRVVYDERDTLEAWIPEFDVGAENDREPGPYETFSNARLKGAEQVLDWLIINGFSNAYALIMAEVRNKEAAIADRYNVPEFGLYDVPLSTVLEYVYRNCVVKESEGVVETMVVVQGQAIPLPEEILHRTNIRDNTRLRVRVIDENTLQVSKVEGDGSVESESPSSPRE